MKKFRVYAVMTDILFIDVEAKDKDEAFDIANETDGGDFQPIDKYDYGSWELTEVVELNKKGELIK